jgi:hypothetical protein
MLESITITGYRGIEYLELQGLKRVTLLVGKNNCGKISVLEAIGLGWSDSPVHELVKIAERRSEVVPSVENFSAGEMVPRHIFRNQKLKESSPVKFKLKGTLNRTRTITCIELANGQASRDVWSMGETSNDGNAVIEIGSSDEKTPLQMRLTQGQTFPNKFLGRNFSIEQRQKAKPYFLGTESLSIGEMGYLWGNLVLGESESIIIQALRGLEPGLERLAFVLDSSFRGASGGHFKVKLKDQKEPVPLGSMGDGMRRFLALAIAMRNCENGVFLIDEIDTGLHYTVMLDMWKFIIHAARSLNIQVFATTHSQDCIDSLAEYMAKEPELQDEFGLQRIEVGSPVGIHYSAEEIQLCVSRRIEMR